MKPCAASCIGEENFIMLNHIYIRDLATIEELNLQLTDGCTMITGETGAGKSVFIEAIELALGGRSSPNLIRAGKEKAEISLNFDIKNFPKVIACLKAQDLYQETSECIIRRVISTDGRSRCYINGSPSTVQLVKELGDLLFHLHGQHEQQVLLEAETQREMLDRFADHLDLSMQVKHLAEAWRDVVIHMQTLQEKLSERNARAAFLSFQTEELHILNLQDGEWEALEAEHHRLTHAEQLLHHVQQAMNYLTQHEDQNVMCLLGEVRKNLETIENVEPKVTPWLSTLHSAFISLNDLESDLNDYLENTEIDPEKLTSIEKRMSQIFNLARKHKITPKELIALEINLESELNALISTDDELLKLEKKREEIITQYKNLAEKLSAQRQIAAAKLEKEISTTIRSLSLPHGEFKIILEPQANAQPNFYGNEKIIFLIKTNPDQALQPLAKVISGGELSRLSLAAHLALANRTTIPTLIFDEVDTGLSGATAEKIGRLLRTLGDSYQVFCVTHQPQVAACGHHHLLVEKHFVGQSTHTRLRLLNPTEKTREIARMLGGEKITQKTIDHAQEMLTHS